MRPQRRRRKRNRSTPTHTHPNKKSKQPSNSGSQSESDTWSDLEVDSVGDVDTVDNTDNTELGATTESTGQSNSHVKTTMSASSADIPNVSIPCASAISTVSTPVSVATCNPINSQAWCTMSSNTFSPYDSGSMINMTSNMPAQPVEGGASVTFGGQPQMLGFSSPYNHQLPAMQMPVQAMPMPFTPSLSEADVMRIALQVKNLLKDEIEQMVSIEVKKATQHLTSEVKELKTTNTKLKSDVQGQQTKLDDLEQYSRRSFVRISGMPETQNENVTTIVTELAGRIQANVTPRDIDISHRVGRGNEQDRGNGISKKPKDIIVKFTNFGARLQFLKGRKALRDQNATIFINEDLTAARNELAFECRELKRNEQSSVANAWTYNGSIFIQDQAGKKYKVTTKADLDIFRPPVAEGAVGNQNH